MQYGSRFVAVGAAVPETVVTNADLAKKVDTSDEWIQSRTGIRERRIAPPEMQSSQLGTLAAKQALSRYRGEKKIDLILVATATPDKFFPSTASIIGANLSLNGVPAFDLSAACSGFIYAMATARAYIHSGMATCVLIIGTEILSKVVDWTDRNTCILFGDGASAAVIESCDAAHNKLLEIRLGADGDYRDLLYIEPPESLADVDINYPRGKIRMQGKEVFKVAVRTMAEAAVNCLKKTATDADDLDWVICHQANMRIIDAVARRLKMPIEKFIINLDRYGNTSAASIGIAFEEAVTDGRIKEGHKLLFVAFGAGFTWGAALLEM